MLTAWRRTRRVQALAGALTVAAALSAAACSTRAGAGADKTHTLTVFAASSLTGAFTELKRRYEAANSTDEIRLNFGSSATLVAQLSKGAQADVFASADQVTMDRAAKAGLTDGAPRIFARNSLMIIVRPGNPKHIFGLGDLDRPGVVVSLGAPQVPVGRYARQALAKAKVTVPSAGGETDVKQVVTRVALGEADAGIVYVTDVRAAGNKATGVPIPANQNVTASYPAVVVKDGPDTAAGRRFLGFLTSPAARSVLASHGFQNP